MWPSLAGFILREKARRQVVDGRAFPIAPEAAIRIAATAGSFDEVDSTSGGTARAAASTATSRYLSITIALCYGAHLCGEPSVPLVDIRLVLGGQWDEALGRGELAAKGILVTVDSRTRLSSELCRALDEL